MLIQEYGMWEESGWGWNGTWRGMNVEGSETSISLFIQSAFLGPLRYLLVISLAHVQADLYVPCILIPYSYLNSLTQRRPPGSLSTGRNMLLWCTSINVESIDLGCQENRWNRITAHFSEYNIQYNHLEINDFSSKKKKAFSVHSWWYSIKIQKKYNCKINIKAS